MSSLVLLVLVCIIQFKNFILVFHFTCFFHHQFTTLLYYFVSLICFLKAPLQLLPLFHILLQTRLCLPFQNCQWQETLLTSSSAKRGGDLGQSKNECFLYNSKIKSFNCVKIWTYGILMKDLIIENCVILEKFYQLRFVSMKLQCRIIIIDLPLRHFLSSS